MQRTLRAQDLEFAFSRGFHALVLPPVRLGPRREALAQPGAARDAAARRCAARRVGSRSYSSSRPRAGRSVLPLALAHAEAEMIFRHVEVGARRARASNRLRPCQSGAAGRPTIGDRRRQVDVAADRRRPRRRRYCAGTTSSAARSRLPRTRSGPACSCRAGIRTPARDRR